MKILITGGSGLVGTALKERISNIYECLFLSSKDCDLRDVNKVNELFENFKPDTVIHLANKVAGLYGNLKNNHSFLIDNIQMNINILECCRKYKTKRLINILSTCVFPSEGISYPLKSSQILSGEPHHSNSGYSYSKRILYIGSKTLCEKNNIKVINLIPTNLYGENDNYNLNDSHVIPGLIHKCYISKKNDEPFIIKGTGSAKRQFVYSNDFAEIIENFILFPMESNYLESIISPPEKDEITIKQLVEKIIHIFNFEGDVIYDKSFSDGQHNKTTNSEELMNFFPFEFTQIDEGLTKTIDYFIKKYPNIRM